MSEGPRIPLAEARDLAGLVIAILTPVCDRVKVAGSVRRKKETVGDIEIVCIPKAKTDLFGEVYREVSDINNALYYIGGYTFPRFNGDKFKQFRLGPCNCDLFITSPECWGMIYTIRTGSADFSHRLVTPKNQGGLCPSYLQAKEGRLLHRETGRAYDTPEEKDVFRIMGLTWIEPEAR